MVLATEHNMAQQQLPPSFEDRSHAKQNNKSKSNTLNSQHNGNHHSSPEKMTVNEMILDGLRLHNLTPKDMGTLISEYNSRATSTEYRVHSFSFSFSVSRQPTKLISTFVMTLTVLGVAFLLFVISVTGFFVMWFTEYYNNTMLQVRRVLYISYYNQIKSSNATCYIDLATY